MLRFTRFIVLLIVLLLALSPGLAQDNLFQTNTPPGDTPVTVVEESGVTPDSTAPVIVVDPAGDTLIPVSLVNEILAASSEQSRNVLIVMGLLLALFVIANAFNPALKWLYQSVPAPFKDAVKSAGVGAVDTLDNVIKSQYERAKLTDYEWDDEALDWLAKWVQRERAKIAALGNTGTLTNKDSPQIIAE